MLREQLLFRALVSHSTPRPKSESSVYVLYFNVDTESIERAHAEIV